MSEETRKQFCIDPTTGNKKEIKVRSIARSDGIELNKKTGLLKAPKPEAPTGKPALGKSQGQS